jgi:hypothetical protein
MELSFEFWYLFPVSIVIATIAMSSGVGGAVFFSPLFMLALKLDPKIAIGSALATELFGFASGLVAYYKAKLIDFKLAKGLLIFSIPAAIIGTTYGGLIPPVVLKSIFAVGLLFIGYQLFTAWRKEEREKQEAAFVKEFELKDPLGLRFSDFAIDKLPPEYTFDPVIIGVVKDFHIYSLHAPIGPMAFGPRGFPPIQRYRNIIVKVLPGEEAVVLKKLGTIWARVRPDLPFRSDFVEDVLAWGYRRERDWSRIVVWATCFALIIAAMGLFGMTAVTIVRRTKETGIRKVLGAQVSDILLLFMKDVLRWVIWANLLAWPIAFFVARKWLQGFAYRIDVQVWMFATAAILSLFVAVLTVGWHALRTARTDPVQSLRYE